MSIRLTLVVVYTAVAVSAAAVAQPSKNDSRPPATTRSPAAPVVLASASQAPAPSAADGQRPPDPAKRRIARVTTCRCGDPQPDEGGQDQ